MEILRGDGERAGRADHAAGAEQTRRGAADEVNPAVVGRAGNVGTGERVPGCAGNPRVEVPAREAAAAAGRERNVIEDLALALPSKIRTLTPRRPAVAGHARSLS